MSQYKGITTSKDLYEMIITNQKHYLYIENKEKHKQKFSQLYHLLKVYQNKWILKKYWFQKCDLKKKSQKEMSD